MTATSFSAAGTGLTGTAASLNIGGTAAGETLATVTGKGAITATPLTLSGTLLLGSSTHTNPLTIRTADGESYIRFLNANGNSYGDLERSITGAGAVRFTGANFRFTGGAEVVGTLTGGVATFSSDVTTSGTLTVKNSTYIADMFVSPSTHHLYLEYDYHHDPGNP